MKRYFLICSLLFATLAASAQVERLPAFGIMRTSGQQFTTAALSKDRPTLLVYFAPDCDHCITFLNALFKDIKAFDRAQLLLVTFKPLRDLHSIERTYATTRYKNVILGSELKPLFLQVYLKLQNTPFVALYDKNSILIRSYRKDARVPDLAKMLNNLK